MAAARTRANNTDGRPIQLSRLETRALEDNELCAVSTLSANLHRKLITIRNLAEAHRPDLYATQLHELAKEAIEIHTSVSASQREVSNHILRKREHLLTAQNRLRTQEALADRSDGEVYRLRCQVDAILNLKGMSREEYDKAQDAARERMDWSDADAPERDRKYRCRRTRDVSI